MADSASSPKSGALNLDLPRIRCAEFHRDQHVDPIGSAAAYDGFLVVDVALPWEHEVTAQEPLATMVGGPVGAVTAGDGGRWRVLARVPGRDDVADGVRKVTEHRAVRRTSADGGIELRGPFRSRSWTVPEADVVALGRSVLGLDVAGGAGGDTVSPTPESDLPGIEVLVCTHGRRDQCCGSLGTPLYEQLGAVFEATGAKASRQRISHTGGHRFAPTAITFPDGYAWAHLDAELVDVVVRRSEPPEQIASHCRGSTFLAGAPVQAADRAALVSVGWDWADSARVATVVGFDRSSMATTVRITGVLADGSARAFEVTSLPDGLIPSPTCGVVDRPEYGTDTVWRVLSSGEVDGAIGPAGSQ